MGLFSTSKKQNLHYLTITFSEPETVHPNSDEITVADLASILESRYHLVEKFCDLYNKQIADKFAERYLRALEKSKDTYIDVARILCILEQDIQELWREYIVDAEHGLQTKASTERGSEPFIDTGAYFRNMRCILTIK